MSMDVICPGLGGLFLLGLGLALLWDGAISWLKFRGANSWVHTTGSIVESKVTVHNSGKGGKSFGMSIKYSYKVMGREFVSDRYSFGGNDIQLGLRVKAEQAVTQNPPGKQLTVHYDPQDPSQSVLEKKYNSANAVLGGFMGIIGAWMLISILSRFFRDS